MKIALCLLTWNEIVGCKNDIPKIKKEYFNEVFCIDNGSSDGTVEYLQKNNIEVYRQTLPGLNQACKDAVNLCKSDAIIFFHPKGSIPIEDLYKFKNYFERGYELVIASRMMKESINEEDEHLLKPRKWFVLLMALFSKALFKKEGNTIWDVLHGFRGITIEAFEKMEISDMSPSIDIEMVCRSYKKRIKRIEFPTRENKRLDGNSHFKAFPTGKKLLKYLCYETFRKK